MERNPDANAATESSSETQSSRAEISNYLSSRSEVFKRLSQLREEGWKDPAADAWYEARRTQVDKESQGNQMNHFRLMTRIGDEMQRETRALSISDYPEPTVLDLCMAPGGYTASALKYNPNAYVYAITLPPALGGHQVAIQHQSSVPPDPRVQVNYMDVTMPSLDFGFDHLATGSKTWHPDAFNLNTTVLPFKARHFDLVICDGQVLRSHEPHQKDWRKAVEASRLTLSQLMIAIRHINPGGTLIMLLHRPEMPNTLSLLHQLDKVSKVRLFKPKSAHRTRSSFYVICQDFQPESPMAVAILESWRDKWQYLTFQIPQFLQHRDGESSGAAPSPQEHEGRSLDVPGQVTAKSCLEILNEWGDRFIALAEPIWAIQAEALEHRPWKKQVR